MSTLKTLYNVYREILGTDDFFSFRKNYLSVQTIKIYLSKGRNNARNDHLSTITSDNRLLNIKCHSYYNFKSNKKCIEDTFLFWLIILVMQDKTVILNVSIS